MGSLFLMQHKYLSIIFSVLTRYWNDLAKSFHPSVYWRESHRKNFGLVWAKSLRVFIFVLRFLLNSMNEDKWNDFLLLNYKILYKPLRRKAELGNRFCKLFRTKFCIDNREEKLTWDKKRGVLQKCLFNLSLDGSTS